MYLFVILDWYSRKIIGFELSSTIKKTFVRKCLKRVFRTTSPEIINSDQGGHFTNQEYIYLLEEAGIKISLDSKDQALDNARTERFFRTIKCDLIYIDEFMTPKELRKAIADYMAQYNTYRPHSSICDRCPSEVCSISFCDVT